MVDISNDNAKATPPKPDPNGHVAVLLTESLIHHLIARSIISVHEAVEIVRIAAEVKEDIDDELGVTPSTKARSLALLERIRLSLSADLPRV